MGNPLETHGNLWGICGLTSITPTEFLHCLVVPLEDNPLSFSRINIRAHFFVVGVIQVWNRLPPHLVAVDDVQSFPRGLDS